MMRHVAMTMLVATVAWCGGAYDPAQGTNFASCDPKPRVEIQGTGAAGGDGSAGGDAGGATGGATGGNSGGATGGSASK